MTKHGTAATPAQSPCKLQGALLDHFNLGVLIIDRGRRIVSANRMARELIAEGRIVYLNDSTLHARGTEAEESLSKAITRAAAIDSNDPIGYFCLRSADGQFIHGYTMALGAQDDGAPDALAVVLHDPRQNASSERHLRRMFELTAAEARVAALIVEGIPVAEAARRLNISIHTVRTQLKNIFAKTGVGRQNELVRVATGGLALIADREKLTKGGAS